ncbi:hypothetical protein [Methanopyrus kandleri]|uniref:hypothetical protein n=1 Tax=Methanopyrus kandleri TaxID=2320 RepID=UPI0011E5384F|nr:hypothetical protein [Methanopyrus kandleri]
MRGRYYPSTRFLRATLGRLTGDHGLSEERIEVEPVDVALEPRRDREEVRERREQRGQDDGRVRRDRE